MQDSAAVGELIWASIAARKPFSLVRLGDGEGALASFSDDSRLEDLSYLEQHFGPDLSIRQVETLRKNLEAAVESADVIGVRDDIINADAQAASLDPENELFYERFKSLFPLRDIERKTIKPHAARRLFQLYQRVRVGLPTQTICSQWICYDLAQDGFWERLLSSLGRINIITSSPRLKARLSRRFALEVDDFIVPEKHHNQAQSPNDLGERHYPGAFRRICAALQSPLHGHVFLVGAGLVGKHYLHLIKRSGGIALDVGALLDAWDGRATRGLIYATKVPLQASQFGAPAAFRLGAGRLSKSRGSEKPKLIFHAGFSRTATTALQAAFERNQETLFERGINYVKAGRGNGLNHHDLARAFGIGEADAAPDRRTLTALLRDIEVEITNQPRMVHLISSELFTNTSPNPDTEDDFIEFINGYDTKVVILVRNQYDWLLSWYAKAASNRNMDLPLKEFLLNPRLEKFDGNFIRKIDWFEKYAPRGGVRIIGYDEHRADLLAAFTNAAELPSLPIELDTKNASPVPQHTVAGVVARRLKVPLKPLLKVAWPPEMVDEIMLLNKHADAREALRATVMERFAEVNAALRQRYGITLNEPRRHIDQ